MPEKIYTIKVIPRSKINKITEETATDLKIKLTAPAVEGKANKALLAFLSRHFNLPQKNIKLLSGEKSRLKKIRLTLS